MSSIQEQGPRTILLATADKSLRYSRQQLLKSFGFKVLVSESKAHAIELISSQRIDLLVFGNTLSGKTCRELGGIFREHQPQGRIVEILNANALAPKNKPDATVIGLSGPLALRQTIEAVLQQL